MSSSPRPRLDHVDAMRPLKQIGVVSTHCMLFFAPAGSVVAGGALVVTHFTRFAFLFLSAAMLVYSYPLLPRSEVGRFARRRILAVALPYVAWTAIYFGVQEARVPGIPSVLEPSLALRPAPASAGALAAAGTDLAHFGRLLYTGYYQLYYLLVLLELCAAYPALLWLVRHTRGHHRLLVGASAVLQVLITSLVHWQLLPRHLEGYWATREIWNYQFFVVAGALLACHYSEVDTWLRVHWRGVLVATAGALAVAEAAYVLALGALPVLVGVSASDPFQPVDLPAFLGISLCLYLAGVQLTSRRRTARLRSWVASAAANSYGVYLSQILFVMGLVLLGWRGLERSAPWPVVVVGAVVVVYAGGMALTSLLARLPLARIFAGRARVARRRPARLGGDPPAGDGDPGGPGPPAPGDASAAEYGRLLTT